MINAKKAVNDLYQYSSKEFEEKMRKFTYEKMYVYERGQSFGFPGSEHYSSVTLRDNIIANIIGREICGKQFKSNEEYSDALFDLKLMQIAIIFENRELWQSVAIDDPMTDQQIAYAFNTTEENAKIKKIYDATVEKFYDEPKLNKDKTYAKKMN